MIYMDIMGGLCNMLFQVAAGYSFSRRTGHRLSIPNFENHINYLKRDEINRNPNLSYAEEYMNFFSAFNFSTESPKHFSHDCRYKYPFHFIEKLPESEDYFYGYFQTEKYFINQREEIISILNSSPSINEEVEKFLLNFDIPKKFNTLHVRLGDYVTYSNHHTNLSLDYYERSLSIIKQKSDLPWLVFSDQIDLCKNRFTSDEFYFVEGNKDYVDLLLMSRGENHIIANSSFSWWGAWLNDKPDKLVVAPDPRKWLGPIMQNDPSWNTKDIVPDTWRVIEI